MENEGYQAAETYPIYGDGPAQNQNQYLNPTPGQQWGGVPVGTSSYNPTTFLESAPVEPCRENYHHFSCRHETYCVCGRVQRRGLEVAEGL